MEERIDRSATSFSNISANKSASPSAGGSLKSAFEAPTVLEISLCCEISAYAPDGDEMPLF